MEARCTTTVYDSSTFAKARASIGSGACVSVKHDCACGLVHVANTRFPGRVVDMTLAEWTRLCDHARTVGDVSLFEWFPVEQYGDFASTFTEQERRAFLSGVLGNEPQLAGSR